MAEDGWLISGLPRGPVVISILLLLQNTVVLLFLIYFRHQSLIANRARRNGRSKDASKSAKKALGDRQYRLYLLGSGGHTTELMEMIKHSPPEPQDCFRRWVITEGDNRSIHEVQQFESWLQDHTERSGYYDITTIHRARKVHQSWFSVPFSSLRCLYDVFRVLTSGMTGPEQQSPARYPDLIFTNGPGSGFIVALMAWILRMAFWVPNESCQILFFESIARVKSLSLTGKLFYYSGAADCFVVQHADVAELYPGVMLSPYLALRGILETRARFQRYADPGVKMEILA